MPKQLYSTLSKADLGRASHEQRERNDRQYQHSWRCVLYGLRLRQQLKQMAVRVAEVQAPATVPIVEGIVLIEIECQSLIHPHRSEMPRRLVIHLSAPWATV